MTSSESPRARVALAGEKCCEFGARPGGAFGRVRSGRLFSCGQASKSKLAREPLVSAKCLQIQFLRNCCKDPASFAVSLRSVLMSEKMPLSVRGDDGVDDEGERRNIYVYAAAAAQSGRWLRP